MLFDNDNLGIDLTLLNLEGFNNGNFSNIMNLNNNFNDNSNTFKPKEGFLRGNMFKGEYNPYKNMNYINIEPTNEQERKLFKLMAYSFAINDLNLHLDLHPEDINMLNLFKKYIEEEKKLEEEYTKEFGPIEVCGVMENKFTWINSPWPWENDGGVKYV